MQSSLVFADISNIIALLTGHGSQGGLVLCFLLAAGLVIVAGFYLSHYGDALGERTGMGEGLVGLVVLAGVTSMPELVVSTTSALTNSLQALQLSPDSAEFLTFMQGGSDLALGNMLGSNVFNLMLFVVMDLIQGHGAFIHLLSRNHIMSAASGLVMLGVLLFGFVVAQNSDFMIPSLAVGAITPILLIAYVVAMVLQSHIEKKTPPDATGANEAIEDTEADLVSMSALRFYAMLSFFAMLIILGGMWLSVVGNAMAKPAPSGFGLGQSFVGTIFLAIATSLPELAICIAAVRSKLYNMAVGNVLGSNIFNLVIVFTSDLGLRGGSILHYASDTHLITMAMVMILTSVVIVSLVVRSSRSFARLGLDAWMILIIYIGGNVGLYLLGAADTKKAAVPPAPAAVSDTEKAPGAENTLPPRNP